MATIRLAKWCVTSEGRVLKFIKLFLFAGLATLATLVYADEEEPKFTQNNFITSTEVTSEPQVENNYFCKRSDVESDYDSGSYGLFTASNPKTNLFGKRVTHNECVNSASGNFFCKRSDVETDYDSGSYGLFTASDQKTNLFGKRVTHRECVSSAPY